MIFDLINKNYLIGAINIFVVTILAAMIGLLLVLQIKAFELQVSSTFSWQFFFHDLFATRLGLIMLIALMVHATSALVNMSGMYSHKTESNLVIYSMCSILWLIIYIATDYAFDTYALVPMLILLVTLILLLGYQLQRLRAKIILGLVTGLVIFLPILGRFTDTYFTQKYVVPLAE